jgi:hypothetical protein
MKEHDFIDFLNLIDLNFFDYETFRITKEITKMCIYSLHPDTGDRIEDQSFYFNSKNGTFIPHYEQKLALKNKIKELKKEFKELEKMERGE